VQYVKDEEFLRKLGNRIREARKARNLSQMELAVLCDNYAEQVGRIERGKSNVSICSLRNIAKALNMKLSDLVDVE
jgi:transcriptional regulator with XRE-family HTH domain